MPAAPISRYVQDKLLRDVRYNNQILSGEFHPSDPGLGFDSQVAVPRIARAAEIGVELSSGLAMSPQKSVSMVFGIGKKLPDTSLSLCDDCPSYQKCTLHAWSSIEYKST